MEELTVFMHTYSVSVGEWFLLPPSLKHGIPSLRLRNIRVVLDGGDHGQVNGNMDFTNMCDWSTFDGLDNVLEEPKFEHLEKFEFLLVLRDSAHCTQESIDMKAAEDLLKRVEGRLLSVRNSGKLTTTVRFIKRDDDIMSICVSFKSLVLNIPLTVITKVIQFYRSITE